MPYSIAESEPGLTLKNNVPIQLLIQEAQRLAQTEKGSDHRLTAKATQFFLELIIQKHRPETCLEIGSFFGDTTRVIAQALQHNNYGRIITLDPFGGERLPAIFSSLPNHLSDFIEYRSQNSMEYFLQLEGECPQSNAKLDLVFIDGHHAMDYCFFDLCRAAYFLKPTGLIVIDNIEQQGPAQAINIFMQNFPGWQIETISDEMNFSNQAATRKFYNRDQSTTVATGCVLAPPQALQFNHAPLNFKYSGRAGVLSGLALQVLKSASNLPLELCYRIAFFAVPYDFHIKGEGLILLESIGSVQINKHSDAQIILQPGLEITPKQATNCNLAIEIELSVPNDNHILALHRQHPIELLYSSPGETRSV